MKLQGSFHRRGLLAGAAWLAIIGAGAQAADKEPTSTTRVPVSTAGATPDAAEMFGLRPAITGPALSPDGSKVLYLAADRTTGTGLLVAAADGSSPPAMALSSDGKPMQLRWCDWADNTRIVCEITGSTIVQGRFLGFERLVSIGADGKDLKMLSQQHSSGENLRISQFDGAVIDWMQGETGKVLLERDHVPEQTIGTHLAKTANGLGVDLVNTHSLAASKVESANPDAESYISDGKGVVRLMATRASSSGGYLSDTVQWYYRKPGSRQWESFSTTKENGPGLRPLSVDPVTDSVYCLGKKDGRDALFRVALDGSMKTELVYADPHVDVDDTIRLGRQARLIGVSTAAEKGNVVYFDPQYRALADALSRALPGLPQITFLSSSDDESKLLISAGSDTDPGRYYVFDKATKHLNEIALVRPQLEHMTLATMTPVSFKASDGTVIPAYLTLPPGSSGKNLPAIVMPHGGPASHDDWGFDWLVQFFAHQGYAVLQPEFRGSTGYGDAWMLKNGFKSWRTSVGDVVDAGRWLVSQGIANPAHLAIVGWSYGGYAALQSNVLDPDLFKAVVAIAPVTDLDMLKAQYAGFIEAGIAADYIGSGPYIAEGSPARHADAFKAPVLMFQGTADQNVDVGESKLMNQRLEAAGKRTTLVIYPDLDHQLPSGEIRGDMLRRADAFLKTSMHLGG
ncbi:MAG TPA: S9 family peptidase [Sphingomonas sp.]|nr:S9 family peptidase [Sphingomonas sp.]